MPNTQPMKLPVWFWVIAGVALIWTIAGVYAYWSDVTVSEEAVAKLPEVQRGLREATPAWVTGVYAVAVFSGLLGAITMLARKKWAVPLFGASLAAVTLQMGYVFFGMNAIAILGASAAAFPAVIIIAGALLLWFSMMAKGKGWLN